MQCTGRCLCPPPSAGGWKRAGSNQQGQATRPAPPLFRLLPCTLSTLALAALLPVSEPATAVQAPSVLARLPAAGTRVAVRQADPAPYRLTPERQALLDTIRFAEGTWRNGHRDGYRTLYGGGLFGSLERHPEITVRRRYTSAAAGAYQFLPGTWQNVAARLKLPSFEPHNQDQAALHLIERRGALALFDRQGLSAGVLARLAPEWASLPASHGGSYYGQPVKNRSELQRFYRTALRQRQQTINPA